MMSFEHWWYHEGSRAPSPGQDLEQHTREMCRIAWSNGEYVRSCAHEKQMQRMSDHMSDLQDRANFFAAENNLLREQLIKEINKWIELEMKTGRFS